MKKTKALFMYRLITNMFKQDKHYTGNKQIGFELAQVPKHAMCHNK